MNKTQQAITAYYELKHEWNSWCQSGNGSLNNRIVAAMLSFSERVLEMSKVKE